MGLAAILLFVREQIYKRINAMKEKVLEVFNTKMNKTPVMAGALTGGISISGKTKLMDERTTQRLSLGRKVVRLFFTNIIKERLFYDL
jgi:hypothetical protein